MLSLHAPLLSALRPSPQAALELFAALVVLGGCDRRPPVDVVVLCDRSSSAAVCDASAVRRAAEVFLEGNPPPASRFRIAIVGCAVEDVVLAHQIEVPEHWGRGAVRKRRQWQADERRRLAAIELPAVNNCSAVASGIWRAARILSERPGSVRRLIVISDLREVDRSLAVNFERKVLAAGEFVRKLRAAQMLPDLGAVEVTVCGVHERATPDAPSWTARKSEQLRSAWGAALAAMNAHGVALTEDCDFGSIRGELLAARGRR